MKKLLLTAVAVVMLIGSAAARTEYETSKAEIASLPQDKVKDIQDRCERKWGSDYGMRIYCEDEAFKALLKYIERNGRN